MDRRDILISLNRNIERTRCFEGVDDVEIMLPGFGEILQGCEEA